MALNIESGVSLKVLTLILLSISSGDSINTLMSTPSSVDGTLTACSGDEILLTCSHNRIDLGSTTWTLNSTSADCNTFVVISHVRSDHKNLTCDNITYFAFPDASPLVQGVDELNSTAVATAMASMSGSIIECRAGNLMFMFINNISLCIIAPTNLHCNYTQNGITVTWDSVSDSCYEGSVNYSVTVINGGNGTEVLSLQGIVEQSRLDIDVEVELNQNYNISLQLIAVQSQSSCDSEVVYAMCEDLDTPASTEPEHTAPMSSSSDSSTVIGVVVFIVIVIIALIVTSSIIIAVLFRYRKLSCDKHNKSERDSKAFECQQDMDHNTTTSPPIASGGYYTELDDVTSGDDHTDIDNKLESIPTKSDETENPAHKSTDSKEMHPDEDKNGDPEHIQQDKNGASGGSDSESKNQDIQSLAVTVVRTSNDSGSKHEPDIDPDKLKRRPAPGGELYTDVFKDKSESKPITTESGLAVTVSQTPDDGGSKHEQNIDSNKLTRQPAPGGELYTDVFKDKSKSEPTTTENDLAVTVSQTPDDSGSKHEQDIDSNKLTRQPAPGGELYTDVFKDDSKLKLKPDKKENLAQECIVSKENKETHPDVDTNGDHKNVSGTEDTEPPKDIPPKKPARKTRPQSREQHTSTHEDVDES